MLNPPVNGKIQGLFNAFECFSSTFQGKYFFQGFFKSVLYIQVLFKPVRSLYTRQIMRFGTVNVLKNVNTFLFLYSNKCWFSVLGIRKMLARIANREDLDQTASSEAV